MNPNTEVEILLGKKSPQIAGTSDLGINPSRRGCSFQSRVIDLDPKLRQERVIQIR